MSVADDRLTDALTPSSESLMRHCEACGSGRARGPAVRFGLRRAAAASPALVGSLLLVLVAAGALGEVGRGLSG